MSEQDARKPYPLDWAEQDKLFSALPDHLKNMVLFAVNTGWRDQEICKLRWGWEVNVPVSELGSVFIIPGHHTKNSEDRLIVLNKTARLVVEQQRGKHAEFVFVYKGKSLSRMMNSAWKLARKKTNLSNVRIHDLKYTFGRRLRSAGVSFDDRQDLLGHKSARITTHYSAAELLNLWNAANRICEEQRKPTLTLLRTTIDMSRAKVAQRLVRVK